jgi:hypothetical protein
MGGGEGQARESTVSRVGERRRIMIGLKIAR